MVPALFSKPIMAIPGVQAANCLELEKVLGVRGGAWSHQESNIPAEGDKFLCKGLEHRFVEKLRAQTSYSDDLNVYFPYVHPKLSDHFYWFNPAAFTSHAFDLFVNIAITLW